ncbi:solute carrier family 15 member 1-like [Cimex lectularius]|uniref:Uncharacterized protein n=1 Tax=Cimex lectularius TaxID=79782 RepID=A0A8I6S7A1_CIMLE|nr:solute carrier family 15 member 1-like [Cimex lectularius]
MHSNGRKIQFFSKLTSNFKWPKTAVILSIMSGPLVGSYTSFLASRPLFITEQLKFTENLGMFFFHIPEGLKLVGSMIAAVLADSYFGKFVPISISYVLQCILVWPIYVLSTYPFPLKLQRIFYLSAIVMEICCSFGATLQVPFLSEQFKMPHQESALQRYYVYDYIYLNMCTILFTTSIIELVNCVHCFGSKCYLIIVGFCYFFAICYAFVFVIMKKWYRIIRPTRNPVSHCLNCLCYAIKQRIKGPKQPNAKHLLDYAQGKYNRKTIGEIKRIFTIISVIVIYCVYSMLYHQLDSKWVYQANHLNRYIGNWAIKPEQIEVLNPLMVVVMAPILEHEVFPTAAKFNLLTTSLQKMGMSYFLTSVAFFAAGILQYAIDYNMAYGATSEGFGQVRLINMHPYTISVEFRHKIFSLKSMAMHLVPDIPVKNHTTAALRSTSFSNRSMYISENIEVMEKKSITYLLQDNSVVQIEPPLEISLNNTRNPVVVLVCSITCESSITIKQEGSDDQNIDPPGKGESRIVELNSDNEFSIFYDNRSFTTQTKFVDFSAIYTFVICPGVANEKMIMRFTLYDPYKIHVFWILPQYFLLSVAEVTQYVGMNIFIYTQSPLTLRSVMRALLTVSHSVAHLTIGALSLMDISTSIWFFSLASFLLLATGIHIWFAKKYQYHIPLD